MAHSARLVRLLSYALRYRRGWISILLVTGLTMVFAVVLPWPMKLLVDHVLGEAPFPAPLAYVLSLLPGSGSPQGLVAWIAVAGVLIFAASSAADVALTLLWIRVGQGAVYDLAIDLFARVQRRSLQFHSRNSVGDSMARITGDSWAAHTLIDSLLLAPLHASLTSLAMLALMFRLNVPLTLLSLSVVPILAMRSQGRGRHLRETARLQREAESQIVSHVQQTLRGIQVVQAFAQEPREQQRFAQRTAAALTALRRNLVVKTVTSVAYGFPTKLATAAVLWVGARQVLRGQMTVGTLLVFVAYLRSLQVQFKTLANSYVTVQTVGAKVNRVCDLLEAEPEVRDRPGAISPARSAGHIVFDDVSFGYEPGRPVLKHISLQASAGETIAIVGPTGAGKSTMISLIPRFFDPAEGRLLLDGHDLRDLKIRGLRDQISLVLQEPFLFPTTIAQNIAYGCPSATLEEIRSVAKAANADGFIARLPEGYDTVIGTRGATLSGGERQRLAIARALLKRSPILILDEPTSALDAQTEHVIIEALGRLMTDRTTFVIAHRLSTIRRADRIVLLDHGSIREVGSHQQLVARGGLYARWHAMQADQPAPIATAQSMGVSP